MGAVYKKGFVSTPDNPGQSKLMLWIRDHLSYSGDECLIWPFGRLRDGYGSLGRAGKSLKAHRYICQWLNGDPPTPEYHCAHSCGNGHLGCVNPRHLSWKTPSENFLEGRKHPARKLTPEKVAQIRNLKGRELVQVTAARFDVTECTIRKVQAGQLWRTGEWSFGGFTSETGRAAQQKRFERD